MRQPDDYTEEDVMHFEISKLHNDVDSKDAEIKRLKTEKAIMLIELLNNTSGEIVDIMAAHDKTLIRQLTMHLGARVDLHVHEK